MFLADSGFGAEEEAVDVFTVAHDHQQGDERGGHQEGPESGGDTGPQQLSANYVFLAAFRFLERSSVN